MRDGERKIRKKKKKKIDIYIYTYEDKLLPKLQNSLGFYLN